MQYALFQWHIRRSGIFYNSQYPIFVNKRHPCAIESAHGEAQRLLLRWSHWYVFEVQGVTGLTKGNVHISPTTFSAVGSEKISAPGFWYTGLLCKKLHEVNLLLPNSVVHPSCGIPTSGRLPMGKCYRLSGPRRMTRLSRGRLVERKQKGVYLTWLCLFASVDFSHNIIYIIHILAFLTHWAINLHFSNTYMNTNFPLSFLSIFCLLSKEEFVHV